MCAINQKNFNVNINEQLSDDFTEQCDSRGYTKYKALEGALRMWLKLSPQEQVRYIEDKTKPSSNDLDEEIRELAVRFATLSEKLANRDGSTTPKKPRLCTRIAFP